MRREDRPLRIEHELFIRSFFGRRPPNRMTRQLTAAMRDVFFADGTALYEPGQPSESVYFIITGEVRLEKPESNPWTMGERSLVGIIDLSLDRPHTRRAVAVGEVHCLRLAAMDYLDIAEDNFDFTLGTLKTISRDVTQTFLAANMAADLPDLSTGRPFVPSPSIRQGLRPLNAAERLMVLRRSALFDRAPVQALTMLAASVRQEFWAAEEPVFVAGDPSSHLYIPVHGELALELPKGRAVFRPGQLLGGHAEFAAEVHPFTANAVTDTLTLRIAKEDLFDVMEDHFGMLRAAMAFMAKGAIEMNRILVGEGADRSGTD